MTYYILNGHPIKTNGPVYGGEEISEQEYKQICEEKNNQHAANQALLEEEMRSIRERNRKIQERMRKIAEDELIAEGEIDG